MANPVCIIDQINRLQTQIQEIGLQNSLSNVAIVNKPLMVDSSTQMSNPSSPKLKRFVSHIEPTQVLIMTLNVSHN